MVSASPRYGEAVTDIEAWWEGIGSIILQLILSSLILLKEQETNQGGKLPALSPFPPAAAQLNPTMPRVLTLKHIEGGKPGEVYYP